MTKNKTLGDHPSIDDTDIVPSETKHFNNTIDVTNNIFEVTTHSATSTLNAKPYLGEATLRSLLNGIKGKQEGDVQDIDKNQREDVLNLLSNIILSSENLSEEEQQLELKNIQNAIDKNGLGYAINRWLGNKLNKYERRLLRVIRKIAYKEVLKDFATTGKKRSAYELEITTSEIYKQWGLKARSKTGGYQDKQTKGIRDLLSGGGNLRKEMLFKQGNIISTSYILQLKKITHTFTKKDNSKEERLYGVNIVLPDFLFVCDADLENGNNSEGYIYQDSVRFSRFMSIKGMEQNESAFPLAEYLEEILSCKQEIRMLDLKTMLREAELEDLYETRPARAIERINKLLDKMVEVKFLISDWRFDKKGGKYDQGQYELYNIRAKLFASQRLVNSTKSSKTICKK